MSCEKEKNICNGNPDEGQKNPQKVEQSNSEKKSCDKSCLLSTVMSFIAVAQAILIVVVACVITCHQCSKNEVRESGTEVIISQPVVAPQDTVSNQCESARPSPVIREVPKQSSFSVDSFGKDYMTILLSLITLCATLAVVIPYLIGKVYTESQVDRKIQDVKSKVSDDIKTKNDKLSETIRQNIEQFRQQFEVLKKDYSDSLQGVDSAIKMTLKELDKEVAHNARMISYLLSHKQGLGENELAVNAWTIGWASKALLRYTKNDYGEYYHLKQFINNSIDYIITAGDAIPMKKIECDEEMDIILRALVDLYDCCVLGDTFPELLNSDVARKKNDLLNILKKLYSIVGDDYLAVMAICNKSKLRNGEENDVYRRSVREKLKEYAILS